MAKPGLTNAQRHILFAAVRKAAAELGEASSEAYRKRVMAEELGVEHLSDVSRSWGFDRIMARFSSDGGDFDRALSYSLAAVGRYRSVIMRTAQAILAYSPASKTRPVDYVAGIMLQSRMIKDASPLYVSRLESDSGWLDFTVPQLKSLLAILSTHLRKLKRKSS